MIGRSRRSFLWLGGAAAAGALIPAGCSDGMVPRGAGPGASTGDGPFALLRRRWRDVTAGSGFDPAAEPYRSRLAELGAVAAAYRDAMAPTGASLWPGLDFPSFTATPARLRTMARAYALPGTGLTGDAALAAAVAAGVDHYRRRVYAAGADPVGNWWDWRIGVPRRLLDAAVLIGPHLGEAPRGALLDAVDHFVPECVLDDYSGTSTGANRVDLCTVTLLRAVLGSDPRRAALAVSALSPVFPYVREGDGFYRDGSFVQHTSVPYQGGYGVVLLSGLATLFAVLRGSPWEVTDPDRRIVFDMVERSFAPVVHDGFCMDLAGGRGIGRRPYEDHRRGHAIAAAVLLLGESASAAERARWRAMVKGWALRDTGVPMLRAAERSDLGFHARLAGVLHDDGIPAAGEPDGHRLPAMSARAVHRRPGWCAGLSMASDRIGHYEHGNGENLRGWHTGAGMLHWWAEGHGDQYSDFFWATVDPYRLPGTTVSTLRLADGAGGEWGDTRPPARWVGGATDGVYAAVGQHLNGFGSTLEAFKSWFFLDDAVVCLGAGITAADGVRVETIVDNRRTGAPLTVGGAVDGDADGVTHGDAEGDADGAAHGDVYGAAQETGGGGAAWAHLEGHGGYVLVGGAPLHTLREERTGRVGRTGGDDDDGGADPVTRSYTTLWLDHGVDPVSAGYVYLLLPGADLAGTRARAADPGRVRVLANTARQQAVRVPSLGITAVNFWTAGAAGDLAASAPCAVLVRERGDGTATLTVADPRRDLDALTVTWDRPVAEVLRAPPLLTGAGTGARLVLAFGRLADQEGGSRTVTVRLGWRGVWPGARTAPRDRWTRAR
ncbi:polysaccharide lyase 8 family protein [Planomonospora sp. ID91781]|uniref:polysaccharide lyase 8 family protein n=1 Tax=Planomonospora sp. ID91781 TaxID=2738135 RepID=UPI0018C36D11|nr:polysaccharide lyase 8 family protein [Planomonospora sp. ID91781]MBG0820589.1 polysaccharide lyase 8 family protein [Planomonospora sp. ID91781]